MWGDDAKELEPNDACIFCLPVLCCIRCSHIWRSEPIYTDSGEQIKPGMPICVRCTSPELLEAAVEDIPRHYRFAALAWHGLDDVVDNCAWWFLYSIDFDTVLYRTEDVYVTAGIAASTVLLLVRIIRMLMLVCIFQWSGSHCCYSIYLRLKNSIEVVELLQQTLREVLWRCTCQHEICFQCIIHCQYLYCVGAILHKYQLIYIYI